MTISDVAKLCLMLPFKNSGLVCIDPSAEARRDPRW
jgi:hypothetical protein